MDNQQTNGIIGDNNQLTMPKVLDYLQNEWLKFEVDRSHWISEKAELNNRILKLESEKKLNYSHNYDLCRRVKMLEYALHQERLKNEALLKNTAIPATTYKDNDNTDNIPITREPPKKSKDNTTRLIIRKYLREMGYDDIIVSKSLQNEFDDGDNNNENNDNNNSKENTINSNYEPVKTILSLKDIKNNNSTTTTTTSTTSPQSTSPPTSNIKILNNIINNTNNTPTIDNETTKNTLNELVTNGTTDLTQSLDSLSTSSYEFDSDSLLDNLKQLDNSSVSSNSNSNSINSSSDSLDTPTSTTTTTSSSSSDSNVTISTQQQQTNNNNNNNNKESDEQSFNSFNEDIFNKLTANSKGRMKIKGLGNLKNFKKESNSGNIDENGNDFTFPPDQNSKEENKSSSSSSSNSSSSSSGSGSTRKKKSSSSSSSSSNSTILSNNELMGLGASDLNDITLDDGSKTGNDSATPRVWKFKHSLKSHFDGVRSIQFHPNEPLMISSSEDHSIKIWNLNHLVPTKKSPSPEIEPIYTIRGHIGPVFTTEWNQINGELSNYTSFFSAGYDMIIRQWSLPSSDIDPYYQHGKVVPFLEREFVGHHDGIWDLLSIPNSNNLLSASSDGTISLWDTNTTSQLVNFIPNISQSQIPTSITLPATENNRKLLAAYNDGSILLFDLETQQIINQLKQGSGGNVDQQINKIVSHPFMPLAITGSEDHKIEFFDLNSKSIVHSMIAHSNSISSLTIDPSGLYIASCSHDSSIRFWEVGSKTCIQDLNSHRPKYDESIHCIKYHPNKGYFASGGADSVIRIHQ